MKAVQFRLARPTNQLEAITKFYTECLSLPVIGQFKNHKGYDGVMIGLPGADHHLEFTQHESKPELPQPTKEHLLVFYFATTDEYNKATERLKQYGHQPVPPENPYWEGKSETFEDPDGWRIVLFNGIYK